MIAASPSEGASWRNRSRRRSPTSPRSRQVRQLKDELKAAKATIKKLKATIDKLEKSASKLPRRPRPSAPNRQGHQARAQARGAEPLDQDTQQRRPAYGRSAARRGEDQGHRGLLVDAQGPAGRCAQGLSLSAHQVSIRARSSPYSTSRWASSSGSLRFGASFLGPSQSAAGGLLSGRGLAGAAEGLREALGGGDDSGGVHTSGLTRQAFERARHRHRGDDLAGGGADRR